MSIHAAVCCAASVAASYLICTSTSAHVVRLSVSIHVAVYVAASVAATYIRFTSTFAIVVGLSVSIHVAVCVAAYQKETAKMAGK